MKVFLDTNFLLDILKFRVDFEEFLLEKFGKRFELIVPSSVVGEIKKLSSSNRYAKVALIFIREKKLPIFETSLPPDKFFLSLPSNSIVCTNDSKLRKSLKKLGIKTIYLRKKKYLAFQ